MRTKFITFYFFIITFLFPQDFPKLNTTQEEEFAKKRLSIFKSDKDEFNWSVYLGDQSISETELYRILGYEDLYKKSFKRDKKAKSKFLSALVLFSASLYMILYNKQDEVQYSPDLDGFDCIQDENICVNRRQPYILYGFGTGALGIYNLYSAYFNSTYYKRIESSDRISQFIKRYNILIIKDIVKGS